MLLEPVIPWFLHDILTDLRGALMEFGRLVGMDKES